MHSKYAINIEIGSTIHCHRTGNQGILVRKPYEKDGYVVLECVSHNTLREYLLLNNKDLNWSFINSFNSEQFPVDHTFDHTSTTDVTRYRNQIPSEHKTEYQQDWRIQEFVDSAAPVFEKMGWWWAGGGLTMVARKSLLLWTSTH